MNIFQILLQIKLDYVTFFYTPVNLMGVQSNASDRRQWQWDEDKILVFWSTPIAKKKKLSIQEKQKQQYIWSQYIKNR